MLRSNSITPAHREDERHPHPQKEKTKSGIESMERACISLRRYRNFHQKPRDTVEPVDGIQQIQVAIAVSLLEPVLRQAFVGIIAAFLPLFSRAASRYASAISFILSSYFSTPATRFPISSRTGRCTCRGRYLPQNRCSVRHRSGRAGC